MLYPFIKYVVWCRASCLTEKEKKIYEKYLHHQLNSKSKIIVSDALGSYTFFFLILCEVFKKIHQYFGQKSKNDTVKKYNYSNKIIVSKSVSNNTLTNTITNTEEEIIQDDLSEIDITSDECEKISLKDLENYNHDNNITTLATEQLATYTYQINKGALRNGDFLNNFFNKLNKQCKKISPSQKKLKSVCFRLDACYKLVIHYIEQEKDQDLFTQEITEYIEQNLSKIDCYTKISGLLLYINKIVGSRTYHTSIIKKIKNNKNDNNVSYIDDFFCLFNHKLILEEGQNYRTNIFLKLMRNNYIFYRMCYTDVHSKIIKIIFDAFIIPIVKQDGDKLEVNEYNNLFKSEAFMSINNQSS